MTTDNAQQRFLWLYVHHQRRLPTDAAAFAASPVDVEEGLHDTTLVLWRTFAEFAVDRGFLARVRGAAGGPQVLPPAAKGDVDPRRGHGRPSRCQGEPLDKSADNDTFCGEFDVYSQGRTREGELSLFCWLV